MSYPRDTSVRSFRPEDYEELSVSGAVFILGRQQLKTKVPDGFKAPIGFCIHKHSTNLLVGRVCIDCVQKSLSEECEYQRRCQELL